MIELPTPSKIASWYHSQILRIPHGNQNPTKRYLTDGGVLELFDGTVSIQEKVDGKLSWQPPHKTGCTMVEDMTGKHTVHNHIIKYSELPVDKRIELDYVSNWEGKYKILPNTACELGYGVLFLESPTLKQIHQILGAISQSPSHFGSPVIEGLVIKNYDAMRFGKWVNDVFEDQLHE